MTHTPGPWRLEINDEQTVGNIWGPNGEHIENSDLGGTFQIDGKAAFERELGDLHLKAAALEMLEALKLATGELNAIRARDGCPTSYQFGPNGPIKIELCTPEWWDELTEKCFAAIAQAEGQDQ